LRKINEHLNHYSLLYFYIVGWLLTWTLHGGFTYWEDQYVHGLAPWWLNWLTTTFENLASEYHQIGVFIFITKYLIFKGSPESRDSDDEMKEMLQQILEYIREEEG
jgi:hypothetical protein